MKIKNKALMLGIIFLVPLVLLIIYGEQPLLERHAYRQTQTALTTFWIIQEGLRLDYLTPVLGFPWSVPLEFPLYQVIVALFVNIFSVSLDLGGRIVGLIFYYLILIPLYLILKTFGKKAIFIGMVMYITSPLELFYSKAFLIETTVTFFALISLYSYLKYLESNLKKYLIIFLISTTLAGLQKITSLLPLLLVYFLDNIYFIFKYRNFQRNRIVVILVIALSILPSIFWSLYSDIIKNTGYLSSYISANQMREWIFGTIQFRLDILYLSKVFMFRLILLGGLIVPVSFIVYKYFKSKIIFNRISFLFIVTGLLGPLIFAPLYFVHDYYYGSSIAFIICGLAIVLSTNEVELINKKFFSIFWAILFVNYLIYGLFLNDFNNKITDINKNSHEIGLYLKDKVQKDDVILILGLDWDSTIPYYSQHYSLMLPEWIPLENPLVTNPENYIGGRSIGAVVVCRSGLWRENFTDQTVNDLMNKINGNLFEFKSCIIKIKHDE